ncbi:hypothetical protein [Isoptericola sp. NPDC057653]|uniref:hypothetical protein n=1 Tax=Isoptericola sp. NPDC057653 TaxID=3346195 RepID=UPI0036BED516
MLTTDEAEQIAQDLLRRAGTLQGPIETTPHGARATVEVTAQASPVRVQISSGGLAAYVESVRHDAQDVFPDVDEVEATVRLASENLIEVIDSSPVDVDSAGINVHGEIWRLPDVAAPRHEVDGDYSWRA